MVCCRRYGEVSFAASLPATSRRPHWGQVRPASAAARHRPAPQLILDRCSVCAAKSAGPRTRTPGRSPSGRFGQLDPEAEDPGHEGTGSGPAAAGRASCFLFESYYHPSRMKDAGISEVALRFTNEPASRMRISFRLSPQMWIGRGHRHCAGGRRVHDRGVIATAQGHGITGFLHMRESPVGEPGRDCGGVSDDVSHRRQAGCCRSRRQLDVHLRTSATVGPPNLGPNRRDGIGLGTATLDPSVD